MKTISTLAVVGLVMALLVGSANAAVRSTTFPVVKVDPPSSVVLGAFQSNSEIRVFDEVQNLTLTSPLAVDILASNATFGFPIVKPFTGKEGTIPADKVINSHLVHADPVGTQLINLTGQVTFNEPILGIILLTNSLFRDADSSNIDSLLKRVGTQYDADPTKNTARGFDPNDTDKVTFINATTIEVNVNVSPFTDQLRVITLGNRAPTADAGSPYTLSEAGSVVLNGTGSDPVGDSISYAWDLDNNGSFETTGQNVPFSATGKDGPSAQTVVLQVCDSKNGCATSPAAVSISNVAPSITIFTATSTGLAGPLAFAPIMLTTNFTDPGPDTWRADFTFSDGSSLTKTPFVSGNTVTHQFTSAGCNASASVMVSDDDGDSDTASAAVSVGAGEFLPPMTNQPVTDKLRNGQVLPVKIRITDCSGNPVTNLTPAIKLAAGDQTAGVSDDLIVPIDVGSASAADTNGVMRFVDGAYIYNMKVSVANLNTDYTIMIYPYATSAADTDVSKGTMRHVVQATK